MCEKKGRVIITYTKFLPVPLGFFSQHFYAHLEACTTKLINTLSIREKRIPNDSGGEEKKTGR